MNDTGQFDQFHAGLLLRDKVRAAYHLALTERPYSERTLWLHSHAADGGLAAAAAFYGLKRPAVLFLIGDPDALDRCLAAGPHPPFGYAAFFSEHRRALLRHAELARPDEMIRMVATRRSYIAPEGTPDHEAFTLTREHLPALEALYRQDGSFRLDYWQFDRGGYVGIVRDGLLAAAAGTHFVSARNSFAIIGNIITHRDYRRRGLGRAVTAALLRRLLGAVEMVCLNVRADNTGAVKLYESLGFAAHCGYFEGMCLPRRPAAIGVRQAFSAAR